MCRKYQLLGCSVASFGLGMLLGCFFDSGFFCGCLGFALIIVGIVLLQKK